MPIPSKKNPVTEPLSKLPSHIFHWHGEQNINFILSFILVDFSNSKFIQAKAS